MVDSIRIDSGVKRIAINDDPGRIIEFNPKDIIFAEKYYALVGEFKTKQNDFISRAEKLEAVKDKDEFGLPVNMGERIALTHEICVWTKEKIDNLFGPGTSEKAFGNVLSLEVFEQFFDGILPLIESARGDKVKKYSTVVADRKKIEDSKAVMD